MNTKLVLAALLFASGTVVALVGAAPEAALTPTDALAAGPGPATVRGMVESVDAAAQTLVLTDGETSLRIRYPHPLPGSVRPGRSLVAEGELVPEAGTLVLLAHKILVGCPSKYEA